MNQKEDRVDEYQANDAMDLDIGTWLRLRGAYHLEVTPDKHDGLKHHIIVDELHLTHLAGTDDEGQDFSLDENTVIGTSSKYAVRNVLTVCNGVITTDSDDIAVTLGLISVDWGIYGIRYNVASGLLQIERAHAAEPPVDVNG